MNKEDDFYYDALPDPSSLPEGYTFIIHNDTSKPMKISPPTSITIETNADGKKLETLEEAQERIKKEHFEEIERKRKEHIAKNLSGIGCPNCNKETYWNTPTMTIGNMSILSCSNCDWTGEIQTHWGDRYGKAI